MEKKIFLSWLCGLLCSLGVYGQAGADHGFKFTMANDFLYLPAPSDHYYTNGFLLEWLTPGLARNPLQALLIRVGDAERVHTGLALRQDIFTPIRKDTLELLVDDRPFASSLALESQAISVDGERGWVVSSSLALGVVGPPAGGRFIQNGFHHLVENSEEVAGWSNEIRSGLLLDYAFSWRQRLWQNRWTRAEAGLRARLGTVHTDVMPFAEWGIGRVRDPFRALAEPGEERPWYANLVLGAGLRTVAYDGTLTGSLFTPDPRFQGTIRPNRVQPRAKIGLELGMGRWELEWLWWYTAPEFEGGEDHTYGSIGLSFWW